MTLTEISDWILEQVKKLNFASAMTGNNFQHPVSNPLAFHLLFLFEGRYRNRSRRLFITLPMIIVADCESSQGECRKRIDER